MSINFTGFNNIKIGKKQYEQFGAYCNHNGEITETTGLIQSYNTTEYQTFKINNTFIKTNW